MQMFRTIAMVILVLIVPLSGAYAGTWALPAPAEAYEKAAPETPTWSDHVHLRTEVALTAASADGTCHAALPGATIVSREPAQWVLDVQGPVGVPGQAARPPWPAGQTVDLPEYPP